MHFKLHPGPHGGIETLPGCSQIPLLTSLFGGSYPQARIEPVTPEEARALFTSGIYGDDGIGWYAREMPGSDRGVAYILYPPSTSPDHDPRISRLYAYLEGYRAGVAARG